MTPHRCQFFCAAAIAIAVACVPALVFAQPVLRSSSMNTGGGTIASGTYRLTATIGQCNASARQVSGTLALTGGFLIGGGCPADFNLSGSVNVQDIFAFLSAWFAGDARADFNGSGAINVQDIFAFLSAWFAGC